MGAAPTSFHKHCDKLMRPKETLRTVEAAPSVNLTPSVSIVIVSRRDLVEAIHKRGAKEFRGIKEEYLVVVENWLSRVSRVAKELRCSPIESLRCTSLC